MLLPHAELLTGLIVIGRVEPEALHVIWRDVWLQDAAHKVWVVSIATTREPILLTSTDVTDTQHCSGSRGATCRY